MCLCLFSSLLSATKIFKQGSPPGLACCWYVVWGRSFNLPELTFNCKSLYKCLGSLLIIAHGCCVSLSITTVGVVEGMGVLLCSVNVGLSVYGMHGLAR